MAVEFSCRNLTAQPLPQGCAASWRRSLGRVVKITGQKFTEVNVVLVPAQAIRRLNHTYRHHDRVTDVLSFAYQSSPVVGDIVICLEQAQRQARRYRRSLLKELELLLIHGSLHLAGWDHQQPGERSAMRALEQRVQTPRAS